MESKFGLYDSFGLGHSYRRLVAVYPYCRFSSDPLKNCRMTGVKVPDPSTKVKAVSGTGISARYLVMFTMRYYFSRCTCKEICTQRSSILVPSWVGTLCFSNLDCS